MSYTHLHIHTVYSLLESTVKISDLVDKAASSGFTSLAITDKDNLHGALEFYEACKGKNIKPIIGVEIGFAEEELSIREEVTNRLLLYAKNNDGYKAINRLVSLAQQREPTSRQPYITLFNLQKESRDLICLIPFEEGKVQNDLYNGDIKEATNHYKKLKKLFDEKDLYIEIQNHWRKREREKLLALQTWLNDHPAAVVATNHVQLLHAEEEAAFKVVVAIKNGETLSEQEIDLSSPDYRFKTMEEMYETLPSWRNALANTEIIAERCNVTIETGALILPYFPLPYGVAPYNDLLDKCERGLIERYGESPSEKSKNRLYYELEIIQKMQYEDYFLIVHDFMEFAHRQGIPTGPGRGSAAGSIVAYVLKITNVDPLKYDLFFERFLNPERITMPDIDIDFSDLQREEVIRYVAAKYGKDRVAQIVTFGTLAAKAALRDAGRVIGIELAKIDKLAKVVPSRSHMTLKEARNESKAMDELLKEDTSLEELYSIAQKIEGFPRHTSIHAAGVVISKNVLTDVTAIQNAQEGLSLTQFSMGDLEKIGLLKIDFLGLRNLSFMDRILNQLKSNENISLPIHNLPDKDEKTFRLLGNADTNGIFQLESDGMKRVLRQLKPTEFEDIVAVNALYRPGPMEQIPRYIARKHKNEKVVYPHPSIKKILERTYGVIIYQEQIMQIASEMAGFSLGEADVLRRAVSKKKLDVLEDNRQLFINGVLKKGFSLEEGNTVYDLIVRFSEYGFNRSHAVAYSMISYQLAYLKAHYPLYFLTALLDGNMHHQEKLAEYVHEAKGRGIEVMPASVLKGEFSFVVKNNMIIAGMGAIKNVGARTIQTIIQRRKDQNFSDFFDFCAAIPVNLLNRRSLEALILSGALDDFEVDRKFLLHSIEDALEYSKKMFDKEEEKDLLFPFPSEDIKPTMYKGEKMKEIDKLRYEKELLGFYVSGHPVESFIPILASYKRKLIKNVIDLSSSENKKVRVAGFIEDIRTITTKKEQLMAFMRLSDESGELECTIFPDTYKEYQHLFQKNELLFVEGTLKTHQNEMKLIVNKSTKLENLKKRVEEKKEERLYLKLSITQEKDGTLIKLKELLGATPGKVPVFLKYESSNRWIRLSEMWTIEASEAFILQLRGLLGSKNVYLQNSKM